MRLFWIRRKYSISRSTDFYRGKACEHQCGPRLGLSGMVNKCELSVNRRHPQQAKDADRLEPKWCAIGTGTCAFPVVDKRSCAFGNRDTVGEFNLRRVSFLILVG